MTRKKIAKKKTGKKKAAKKTARRVQFSVKAQPSPAKRIAKPKAKAKSRLSKAGAASISEACRKRWARYRKANGLPAKRRAG